MRKTLLAAAAASALLGGCVNYTSRASTPAPAPIAVTESRTFTPEMVRALPLSKPAWRGAYADASPLQVGELRLPKGKGPFPVAMVVHGGCYLASVGESTSGVAPLAAWLAERGVATWNVGWRPLGKGGGWTATFEDWAGGLAYLTELRKKYPLDLDRVSIVGHSAGATAASWLAGGNKGDLVINQTMPKVRSVVILDGPSALAPFVGADKGVCGQPVIVPLMGGTPAQVPSRYAMVDPTKNTLQISSLLQVAANLPHDPSFVPAIRAKGVDAELIVLPRDSHFDLIVPGTRDFVAIAPALLKATGGR